MTGMKRTLIILLMLSPLSLLAAGETARIQALEARLLKLEKTIADLESPMKRMPSSLNARALTVLTSGSPILNPSTSLLFSNVEAMKIPAVSIRIEIGISFFMIFLVLCLDGLINIVKIIVNEIAASIFSGQKSF